MADLQFLTGEFDILSNSGSGTDEQTNNFANPVDTVYAVMTGWSLKYTGGSAHNIKIMQNGLSAVVDGTTVTTTFEYTLQGADDNNKTEGTASYLLIGISN